MENDTIIHGWVKKRSRHLKQWKRRFIQIEDQHYLCSYHKETVYLQNCTEKIDIRLSTIHYSIDTATQFQIHQHDQNKNKTTEFSFECESIAEANDWLKCLKTISKSTHEDNDDDLNLIVPPMKLCNRSQSAEGINISHAEVTALYMKAITLYQNKHYEECRFVINSVLTIQPEHPEAAKLLGYLAGKRVRAPSNQIVQRKGARSRCKTAPDVQTEHPNGNAIQPQIKKSKFAFFKGSKSPKSPKSPRSPRSPKSPRSPHSKAERDEKEEDDEKQTEINKPKRTHPCQVEFARFIMEKAQLNEFYDDLMQRFESAKYNDIRFLKDFDENMLREEIRLKPLHSKCFMRKVEIFLNEVKLFRTWLNQVATNQKGQNKITSDGLIGLFENEGITTFEALYRIKSRKDLGKIMIDISEIDRDELEDIIWNEMHRMASVQTIRMQSIAKSYLKLDGLGLEDPGAFPGPGFSLAVSTSSSYSQDEGILMQGKDMDIIKAVNAITPDLIIIQEEEETYGQTKGKDDDVIEEINDMYVTDNGDVHGE